MLLFVVVMTTWQHRVNLRLPTFVPLALKTAVVCYMYFISCFVEEVKARSLEDK